MSSLTRYPSGSLRELWAITTPLMITSLSGMLMMFCDRWMLAHYSPMAMSASAVAGTMAWAVLGSLMLLASMSEVFVSQYNGAGQFKRIGIPVWQMFWFSLVVYLVVLLPLGQWGGDLLFVKGSNVVNERTYWRWMIWWFGLTLPVQGALTAFYVGRGKTQMVMVITLGINLLNLGLDWLMIFGVEGLLPAMGVKGAAMASGIAYASGTLLLMVFFLCRRNREELGTDRAKINWKEMRKCLRVAAPHGTVYFIEIFGWGLFMMMLRGVSSEYAFISGVAQTLIILFFFVCESTGRGITALAGNAIGAQESNKTVGLFWAGIRSTLLIFGGVFTFFYFFPNLVVGLFTRDRILSVDSLSQTVIAQLLTPTMWWSLLYIAFEGLRWVGWGLLNAAGDTLFILLTGLVIVPLFQILPAYLVIYHTDWGIVGAYAVAAAFSLVSTVIFTVRFFSRRWEKINLVTS